MLAFSPNPPLSRLHGRPYQEQKAEEAKNGSLGRIEGIKSGVLSVKLDGTDTRVHARGHAINQRAPRLSNHPAQGESPTAPHLDYVRLKMLAVTITAAIRPRVPRLRYILDALT